MSNPRVVALLDANEIIINTIVVDDTTPEDFLQSLIDDDERFINVKATEKIDQLKINPAIGWKRTAPGKYDPPPVVESDPEINVVSEVLSDDRLGDFSSAQKAVLEDVLSDHIT